MRIVPRHFFACIALDHKAPRYHVGAILEILALFIGIIALVILTVWWMTPPPTKPRLSVAYVATINGNGHWRLKFGVTNVSSHTIVTYKQGEIEMFGCTNKFLVGATAPMARLAPGQGHFVEAVISEQQMASLDGPWHFTCLYANDDFRTRANRGEFGAFLYKHIPRRWKGVPLTATGTSDWINEPK